MAMVTIALDRNDLGHIVDGLTQRMESYDHTAAFLDDEDHNLEGFLIEEVTDSAEARALASNYKRIIDEIAQQLVVRK